MSAHFFPSRMRTAGMRQSCDKGFTENYGDWLEDALILPQNKKPCVESPQ